MADRNRENKMVKHGSASQFIHIPTEDLNLESTSAQTKKNEYERGLPIEKVAWLKMRDKSWKFALWGHSSTLQRETNSLITSLFLTNDASEAYNTVRI
jgi:hypothetical protein